MNKFFTTILAIVAMVAFSTKADAAVVNDSLVININVQISHNLEIQWDNGGAPAADFAARNWNLGTAATVNLNTAYDTQTHDPIDLDIRNDTNNVPVQLDLNITDGAANWDHALATGAQNEYVLEYSVNDAVSWNATTVGSASADIISPLVQNDVVNFELRLTTPSSISTGNSGQIVATVFVAPL